jgi:hypothetical protein
VTQAPDRDDASSVAVLPEILNDPNEVKALKVELADIHSNFSFLS